MGHAMARTNLMCHLGSGLIDLENEDRGEGYRREEGVSASVVSRVDTSPVLEAGEHVSILWRWR
jgi:hypothetical protein